MEMMLLLHHKSFCQGLSVRYFLFTPSGCSVPETSDLSSFCLSPFTGYFLKRGEVGSLTPLESRTSTFPIVPPLLHPSVLRKIF